VRFVDGAYPDAAWALFMIAVLVLFLVIPKRRVVGLKHDEVKALQ
jgi:hypothetical protein